MLSLSGYRLMLYNGIADMRMGPYGLSGKVTNEMKEDPCQKGTAYAFFNLRRNHVKMITWEGDGFGLYAKRLTRGTFGTPVYYGSQKMMEITKKDLMLILEGIEIKYRKRYEPKR